MGRETKKTIITKRSSHIEPIASTVLVAPPQSRVVRATVVPQQPPPIALALAQPVVLLSGGPRPVPVVIVRSAPPPQPVVIVGSEPPPVTPRRAIFVPPPAAMVASSFTRTMEQYQHPPAIVHAHLSHQAQARGGSDTNCRSHCRA